MGCCNDTSTPLAAAAPRPWLHVNYAKGMVLGVDDLTQEFAYLAGRDQWAVRDLLGYGTLSGLAVRVDDTAEGPRVRVAAGSAAVPSGRLVCVSAEQCALLDQWLAKPENAALVDDTLAFSSPPAGSGTLSLYLTLCYADCTTQPVPIPGDPCRSEDQLMADSRIADDYRLELRIAPPPQVEEDALRDFLVWLRAVPVVDGAPPAPVDAALERQWAQGVRLAAQPWLDLASASPPVSSPPPGDYLFDSPPTALAIASAHLTAFLRVALRVWVTELRPLWQARAGAAEPRPDEDCVLLARLAVPVVWSGGAVGAWQVSGPAAAIAVDESRRPLLVHARLLEEWLLGGASPPAPGAVQAAITRTNTDLTLDDTHYCVICDGGRALRLPKCDAANRGRIYIVKSPETDSKIGCDGADTIDGTSDSIGVKADGAVTLISDGDQTWHLLSVLG